MSVFDYLDENLLMAVIMELVIVKNVIAKLNLTLLISFIACHCNDISL